MARFQTWRGGAKKCKGEPRPPLTVELGRGWDPGHCWAGSGGPWPPCTSVLACQPHGGGRGSPQPTSSEAQPPSEAPASLNAFLGPGRHLKGNGASPRPGALVWEGASDELILW